MSIVVGATVMVLCDHIKPFKMEKSKKKILLLKFSNKSYSMEMCMELKGKGMYIRFTFV